MGSNRLLSALTVAGVAAVCLASVRTVRVEMDNRHFRLEIGSPDRAPAPVLYESVMVPAGSDRVYRLNRPCDTDPALVLHTVTIEGDRTELALTFSGRQEHVDSGVQINTGAPGEPSAFFLRDSTTGREFPLRKVEGITLDPWFSPVRAGKSERLVLTFDRIPDDLSRFELIEGKDVVGGRLNTAGVWWDFHSVELK
jgi:hypothetical protein